MIKLKDLTKKDVGKWVEYPCAGFTDKKDKDRIKSWNEKFILVVYKCDVQWERFWDYTAAATYPADLEFTNKGEVI